MMCSPVKPTTKHDKGSDPLSYCIQYKHDKGSDPVSGNYVSRQVKAISPFLQPTLMLPPYCWQMLSAIDSPMP